MTAPYGPPKPTTIEQLLAAQGAPQVTSRQDEARQALIQRLSAPAQAAPDDRWGNVQNAVNTAIGYWAGQKQIEQAEKQDQAEQQRTLEQRRGVANALASAGIAPEQAATMASGSPEQNSLVMNLMGMQRQDQAAESERAYREQQAQVEQQRFDQQMDFRRSSSAADRALKQQQIAAASRPKEPSIVSALRHAGIDPASPEGQTIIRDNLTGAAQGQNATQFGSVPAGMARVADPNAEAGYRIVPLQGSKEQREAASADEKKVLRQEKDKQDFDTMMRDINRVLGMSREGAGGPIEGQFANAPLIGPMTSSGQMAKHLESIKANIAFDELQAMRDSSPTGGAVGQLTDKERDALAATAGSLDPALPEEDMQRNLIDLGVKRITAVHGTDGQIDAALKSGRVTPEQAEQGRAIRDQQIAEFTNGGANQQPATAFAPEQIETLEQEGAALEQQYIANGMDPREAEQLVMDELKKKYGL